MDEATVERWVDGYVRAWSSNDPADIGALFTEEAEYRTAPWREPWSGREAIVAGWLARKDEPGGWSFEREVLAVAGDLAFVRGRTGYPDEGEAYSNLWAAEFTEWWMPEE
jgi:ketosteroid isomerase-like protein